MSDTRTREWTLYSTDSLTERARKLAEISLASVVVNPERTGMVEPAAFALAQALERYEMLDRQEAQAAAAGRPTTNPALAAPAPQEGSPR